MSETKTTTNPADLIKEAQGIITNQDKSIKELQRRASEAEAAAKDLKSKADAIKSASAYGPDIANLLIEHKLIPADKRELVIQNMSNPVKVAVELKRVLEMQRVTPVGQVDNTKEASPVQDNPMLSVDEEYRREVGLS